MTLKKMISVDEALGLVASQVGPLDPVRLPLEACRGRVLSEPARAICDRPPFDRSAMDGYALRSEDTAKAGTNDPATLRVVGESAAGGPAPGPVLPGEAQRIMTGAALPRGADAVVRQEDVERVGAVLSVTFPVRPWNDIRRRAEEAPAGSELGAAGIRLGTGAIAAFADAGVAELPVRPRPKVAVLVTGDELTPVGNPLPPGRVHDVNGPLMRAFLDARGLDGVVERVGDSLTETAAALARHAATADLVVTTGGVSVGEHDHVPIAAREAGYEPVFWKVRQKPGKPLFFARRGRVPLIGLPGNPASVFVGLALYVDAALGRLEGEHDPSPVLRTGVAAASFPAATRQTTWVRCRVEPVPGDPAVRLAPLTGQASHMLSNLLRCDAIARLEAGRTRNAPGSPLEFVPVTI